MTKGTYKGSVGRMFQLSTGGGWPSVNPEYSTRARQQIKIATEASQAKRRTKDLPMRLPREKVST